MSRAPDTTLADDWCPSATYDERREGRLPDLLLMHYTGMTSAQAAIKRLCATDVEASAHYLIDVDGRITQMVCEAERGWHAGKSVWAGETDINSCSIGIEIHNPGHEFGYVDYPEAQMQAVEALSLEILSRHAIPPERVLAHSDIAPNRKQDPGERFDWQRLHAKGIGHWVPPEPLGDDQGLGWGDADEEVLAFQEALASYGYGIPVTGFYDKDTEIVVTAFQRHFRPARVDGRADASTIATLEKLAASLATNRLKSS